MSPVVIDSGAPFSHAHSEVHYRVADLVGVP